MKRFLQIIAVSFLLASCGPSQKQIEEAVQQTQVAVAEATAKAPTATRTPSKTPTKRPTKKPSPTKTKKPTPINTPSKAPTKTPTVEPTADLAEMTKSVVLIAESFEDVKAVNTVRYVNGVWEVELQSVWASKDKQPPVSYEVIKLYAYAFCRYPEEHILKILGGDKFGIKLTTYSTDSDYQYESFSDYPTLLKVVNKEITYDEWIMLSGAAFK